jgi:hypothetical protein
MDSIFSKSSSWLDVVRVARSEPRRYDNHGEPIASYLQSEEHKRRSAGADPSKYETLGSSSGSGSPEADSMTENGYSLAHQEHHTRHQASPPDGHGRRMRSTMRDSRE